MWWWPQKYGPIGINGLASENEGLCNSKWFYMSHKISPQVFFAPFARLLFVRYANDWIHLVVMRWHIWYEMIWWVCLMDANDGFMVCTYHVELFVFVVCLRKLLAFTQFIYQNIISVKRGHCMVSTYTLCGSTRQPTTTIIVHRRRILSHIIRKQWCLITP